MKAVIISPFEQQALANSIAESLGIEPGEMILREFPDGESYLRLVSSLAGKELIILSSLDSPNQKILPLLFLAETAREMGAKRVGLVAPYLAYMRQDKRFQPGEGVTSDYFAALLSRYFDWLVTVDPHLHRHHYLNEIYSIPNSVLHATSSIAQWIKKEVRQALIIGPDSESEQWVAKVAKETESPYLILEKKRYGDRRVEISLPQIEAFPNHTPVLVDDIISTGQTMLQTVMQLKKAGMKPPVCIGVHAVFADNAYDALLKAGVEKVVTCNTIQHVSNCIDLTDMLSNGISECLD